MNKQIIVFAEISPIYKWLIRYYLFRKKEVYFVRLNKDVKAKGWVKDFVNKGRLKKIDSDFGLYSIDGSYDDLAFDNINTFAGAYKDDEVLKEIMKLYYNNNDFTLALKKRLNQRLGRFYYLNHLLHQLQSDHAGRKIAFVPFVKPKLFYETDNCEIYDYFKFYQQAKSLGGDWFDTKNVKFPVWAIWLSYINAALRKLKILAKILGFYFLVFFLVLKILIKNLVKRRYSRNHRKSSYKYAITVSSPKRQFANKIQKVDFLIDGEMIKKEDVVFLSLPMLDKKNRLDKENKDYMQHNELDFIDDPDMFISATEAIKIFPIYRLILKSSFKKDDLLLYTGLSSLYLYLRWKCFSENIRIENLISHADFGITSITRNIILEEYGCVTYYYMNTINYDFYYDRRGRNDKYRDSRFGFLYYDYLFVWNDTVSKYFKASQCKIKEYLNLGSFWAEHLRLIEEKVWTSDFRNELYDRGYKSGMKLVSVFDSGLSDEYITTYEDGIKFLEGILRLLDDLPDIFVVLKEKKPRDYHKMMSDRFDDILKLYQKLENNARCLCIKNSWKNSSEIMAFTDLVISFPFTSTTAEALAVRKKAIWYDGTDKFRGAIYDNAPGLVCHNYNELLERTKRLLCISEKDYNAYLESYIKGRVENYLDGKAITRFREHLSEKSSNHAGPKKASKGRLHEYTYQR